MKNKKTSKSKIKAIAKYMKTHKFITQLKAIELCQATRLASEIYKLKHNYGWQIGDVWDYSDGDYGRTRYKKYFVISIPEDSAI